MNSTSLFNDSRLNSSDDSNILAETGELVDKICSPIIYAIGIPGNILSLIVWMQKRMRHSSGYYLAALALNDLCFIFLHMVFELEYTWNITVWGHPFICQVYPTVYLLTQVLSPCFVLAFTTERYISICHAFKRETFCTVRRAKIVILCLIFFSFCMLSFHFYIWTLRPEISSDHPCQPRDSVTEGGTKSVFSIYNICIETLAFLFVPVAILILNVLVILEMRRLSKTEQSQQGPPQRIGSTTVMLLAVSFYQIFTILPVSILQSMKNYYQGEPVFEFVVKVGNEYGNTHYAFNIFIYLITGQLFRRELKRLFLKPFENLDYSSLRTSMRRDASSKKAWLTSINGKKCSNKNTEVKSSETPL